MAVRRLAKGFLANFRIDDKYLVPPDRSIGKAGLIRGRDRESQDLLIKYWPRAKDAQDRDLEDIWRSEIRQLQRLAAVPRANELLVPMVRSGKDDAGFYVVLNPGQGSPLEIFQSAHKKPELLAQARQPRVRRILWANAQRLAEALELLHSQSAIHRNLDPWSVVTALGTEPDFRLTGFEWSMRISGVHAKRGRKLRPPRIENSFSFTHDWRDLALLFALFLDIPTGPLADPSIIPSRVAEHISAAEVKLLRTMLGVEFTERLDGEFVCTQIAEILDGITAEAAGKEAHLFLAARLGGDSRLSQAIRRASENEIEIASENEQLKFMANDLGRHAQLVAVKDGIETRYVLVGSLLTYRLAPYRPPFSDEAGNWEFAYCERAESDTPYFATIEGETTIEVGSLQIVRNAAATHEFPRRRGKVQNWDQYIERTKKGHLRKTDLDRMHQSLALLLVIEMAYAAADIFPVEITSSPVEITSKEANDSNDTHIIRVISRRDDSCARLSELLKLESPAIRLSKLLESDEGRDEGSWVLSEPGALGERSQATTSWRYIGIEEVEGAEYLKFEGSSQALHRSACFLSRADMTGRIVQFKRRLKALTALRRHAELLQMLADPRSNIQDSQDPLDEKAESFCNLDNSKQQALREILSTVPLFLLQGPPGVGKTYLVGDVVRRRFEDEPTTRILLSAQSNSAIDHLMSEVQSIFASAPAESKPLMVRARPADDDEAVGELEIDVQAARLLQSLAESDLTQETLPHIRERIKALADAKTSARQNSQGRRLASELRAFEGMILRSANLVFATTNSSAVERLIEERGLFDWTIIEEAGKATGGELLSPLLLSHRRLMIGDHKQLPPFDIDKMSEVLSLTSAVQEIVSICSDLISRYLKDSGTDEIFTEVESADGDFGRTCADTLSVLVLFETLVEREFSRQKAQTTGRPVARRLTEQYRMHPAIARIVSHCFYDGSLTTNLSKEKKFLTSRAPCESIDPKRLPNIPVVFVDIPYSREEGPGGLSGEQVPRWTNAAEVSAAIEVLKLMRAEKGQNIASLAVLSPYWQQVKMLERRITQELDASLSHLSEFSMAINSTDLCGTVDSFQGGEADVVVVSLVRNNSHVIPLRALGFLRDSRRMNVLLSRAKWRLIIIGSLSFYRKIVEWSAGLPDQEIGFLSKFLSALDEGVSRDEAAIVPLRQLQGIGS